MKEGVASIRFAFTGKVFGAEREGLFDIAVDEIVDYFHSVTESLAWDKTTERAGASDNALNSLDFCESVGKFLTRSAIVVVSNYSQG